MTLDTSHHAALARRTGAEGVKEKIDSRDRRGSASISFLASRPEGVRRPVAHCHR